MQKTVPEKIASAIIGTDASLREMVGEVLRDSDRIAPAVEVDSPFSDIRPDLLARIREKDPHLVFVDLEDDPRTGIRFVHFLSEGHPHRRFIGFGPELEPALLLEAMRAGLSEYLPKPVEHSTLVEAVTRMERRLAGSGSAAPRSPGELLAVFSPKGGSGSTTLATNLAIHLHHLTGKRTLLVDLDLELGEIAVLLGVQPRFTFVDMVRNFHRMDAELLASYIESHDSGVHLLSAPFHPEKVEAVTAEGIRKILQFLKQHYDYVVVDTSKSFTPATLATFEQADRILLVTNVDLPSLRNIKRCQPLLDRIVGSDTERVRLIVNRHHENDLITIEEVERTIGMGVYFTLANDYESVIRSINSGRPVINNERSPFARDLRLLAEEITGLSARSNGRRSHLGRIGSLFGKLGGGKKQHA